ncbi:hypothetical protein KCU88_g7440, partial [Aureobasidium melanogenum]
METQETHTSKKERKGLRKVWDRVKAIFKPKTATTATTSTSAIPASTSQGQPSVRQKPEPQPESKLEGTAQPPRIEVDDTAEESPVALEPTKQPPAKAPISVTHDPQDEAQMRFSKAQAIFAKYNLELSPADWDMRPKQPYERVSKNIRMRSVRYLPPSPMRPMLQIPTEKDWTSTKTDRFQCATRFNRSASGCRSSRAPRTSSRR